jgi:hypothetical protein
MGSGCICADKISKITGSMATRVREDDKYEFSRFYNEHVIDATLEDFVQRSLDKTLSAETLNIH